MNFSNYRMGSVCRAAGALIATLVVGVAVRAIADTPPQLMPPAGNTVSVTAHGVGVQIYVSVANPANPGTFVWKFVAPEATLYNNGGHQIGTHFAGPTWQATNGSAVVGAKIASVASPDATSIPWLLLKAVSHAGHGMFSEVTYAQRLDTVGGAAPADAPSAAGLEARVPYSATYVFYEADGSE